MQMLSTMDTKTGVPVQAKFFPAENFAPRVTIEPQSLINDGKPGQLRTRLRFGTLDCPRISHDNNADKMPYLRHALNLFLLLTVLALAIPSACSQDNTKSDDSTSQSDRSDDQSTDQMAVGDFIFEHASIFQNKLPREIRLEQIFFAPKNRGSSLSFSCEPSFCPHIFISGVGLMPRAPALV